MKRRMNTKALRYARRITQGAFLALFLFLFLQTESQGENRLGYPVRLFLDCDPLIALSTVLSSRTLVPALLLSLIVVVMTLLMGRVFCGWICPLGTLHDIAGMANRLPPSTRFVALHRLKYYILAVLLAASLFTVQLTGLIDPVSLLIRSLALGIFPALNITIRAVFDTLYEWHVPGIVHVSEYIYGVLKESLLTFNQYFFRQALSISLLIFTILALNLVERRFWCKYLCPLGALLGVLSRWSLLSRSVSEGCNDCGLCAACTARTMIDGKLALRDQECFRCLDCDDLCTRSAIGFSLGKANHGIRVDLRRRHLIGSMTAGIAVVPFLRIAPLCRAARFDAALIRPPGALPEKAFLSRCVRCGECMKVCITNGLQPTLLEAGVEGIWTPVLVPAIGHCEYRCTLCGQVCPTGAIRKLDLNEKAATAIGVAVIDTGRCLPYSFAVPCIVCEEMCPTAEKAIWLETRTIAKRDGTAVRLRVPRVDPEKCIGCGTCEAHCPVAGKPAIYVISTGESRSEDNRLLF